MVAFFSYALFRRNRLVMSVGELAIGPFLCQLSPGLDVFSAQDLAWVRVTVASGVSRRG